MMPRQVHARGAARVLLAAALAGLLAASCGGPEKKVIAEVAGRKITVGDLVLQYRSMSVNVRPFVDTLEGKRNFLNDIINKEILLSEAEKRGIDKSPRFEKGAEQFLSTQVADAYFQKTIRDKIQLSDAAMHELYDRMSERVNLRIIFLTDAAKAHQVDSLLKKGADFATVAHDESADAPSAANGGEMGMKTWAEYPPELVAAARPLKDGERTGVIASEGGFVIARVEGRQPNPLQDFAGEKPAIMTRLRAIVEDSLAADWKARTLAETPVTLNDETINFLVGQMKSARGPRAMFAGQIVFDIPQAERSRELVAFGSHHWTLEDYLQRLATIPVDRRPPPNVSADQMASFVRDLALRELAAEQGRKMGLADDPDVKTAMKRYRERWLVDSLHVALSRVDSVSTADMQRYYQEHQASLIAPASARYLPALFASEADARGALKRIRFQSTSLKRVIEEESLDRTGGGAGDQGVTISRSPDPTPLEKAVFSTEPMRMGGPVKTDKGWIIFRVLEKSGELPLTYTQAEPQVRRKLAEEAGLQRFDDWLAAQHDRLKIKVNEKVLAGVDFGSKEHPDTTGTGGTETPTEPTPVKSGG